MSLLCPIRREMILTDTGPREVASECLETSCAWWFKAGQKCAVLDLCVVLDFFFNEGLSVQISRSIDNL